MVFAEDLGDEVIGAMLFALAFAPLPARHLRRLTLRGMLPDQARYPAQRLQYGFKARDDTAAPIFSASPKSAAGTIFDTEAIACPGFAGGIAGVQPLAEGTAVVLPAVGSMTDAAQGGVLFSDMMSPAPAIDPTSALRWDSA